MKPFTLPVKGCINSICYAAISFLFLIRCADPKDVSPSSTIDDAVLMQVSFTAETVRFTKLAEHVDPSSLTADANDYVAARSVPIITREKQELIIFKDGNFRLTIDKLNPDYNPVRDAFRKENAMQPWEVQRVIITKSSITGFDGQGAVVMSADNPQHVYLSSIIEQMKKDPYFAANVNIGNALFKVSAKAENYTDPKLKSFFVPGDAVFETQNQFLLVKQNAVSLMKHMGGVLPSFDNRQPAQRTSFLREFPEDASFSPEVTSDMIREDAEILLNQRDFNAVEIITAINTVTNTIDAEVVMTTDGQVLSMTSYYSDTDETGTIQVAYTESFETDPVMDVDLLAVESTTYSNVNIFR